MRKQIIWPLMFFCCLLMCQNLMAQVKKVTVKGTILDAVTKEPLTGATIGTQAEGGKTQADINGKYTVTVDEGSVLTFTFVSYKSESHKLAAGETTVNINMTTDAKQANEVVIRGYVKRNRDQTTGSSYIITGKEVQDNPVGNVEQLLQGKVAGLNIQNNTGAPGMRGSVNIRGLSTIATTGTGDAAFLQPTSPLYVIDGVPLDADKASEFGFDQQGPGVSPLSLIPQEDIASMEILKDATATALYGSRGAYGVILIQTVRGKSKVPVIRYSAMFYLSAVPKLRETLGGAAERSFKVGQINKYGINDDKYRLSNTQFLSDSLNAYYNNSTNWQGIFYANKFNTTHNIALDGGDARFNYKVNLKYFSQSGLIEKTGFENYSMNMNMEFKPSSKLSFFGQIRTSMARIRSGSGNQVLQTVVNANGNKSTLQPGPSFLLATSDVLSSLNIRESSGPKNLSANLNATYELLPGLSLQTNGNYTYEIETQDKFLPAAANGQFARIDNFYGYSSELYNRNNLTYTKSLGQHNLFFNVFNEIYVKKRQQSYTRITGTPNDQYEGPSGYDGNLSRGAGVLDNFYDLRTASYAFAFTYDFKKKYVLDLTYRLDGSSANGPVDPYTKNPSVGFRWNITKEDWIANHTSKWLDQADLRLSVGQNIYPIGNLVDIYGRYNPNGFYNNQARVGIDFGRVPNPNLLPKKVLQYNLGFDATLFNSHLDITFDTYYKAVTNDLVSINLSNVLAFGSFQSNDGAISNYGYELALTIRPLKQSAKVKWTMNVNGALNYDVLVKLPAIFNGQYIDISGSNGLDVSGQFLAKRVGRNSLSNYLFTNEGVYATTAQVPVDPVTGVRLRNLVGNNPLNSYQGGDARLKDLNGDYVIDVRDRSVSGNTQPLITGGFSNTIGYGQFSLNVYCSYTAVRSVLNNSLAQRLVALSNPFGTNAVPSPGDLRIWRGTGDATATYANVYNYAHEQYMNNFRGEQTLWQEDGSYFKINQATLSYNLPKDLVKRLGLNAIRTTFTASNLAVFTPYSGPNVENVNNLGKDIDGAYPNPRTYTLGLNVNF
ncbi:MAG: SusC/RagA family TonB-linked outer membrane protein [Bacteroidota bacterium]